MMRGILIGAAGALAAVLIAATEVDATGRDEINIRHEFG